jgi:hypothetical protein
MNWLRLSRSWFYLAALLAAAPAGATSKPVLNDWFALGSGCRAKSDLPGNVKMEGVPVNAGTPDTYQARFFLRDFALNSDAIKTASKKFGRECAVRLNINPPPGKKIVGLKAVTSLMATKETGPELDLLAELKLGSVSLGQSQARFGESARVRQREEKIELLAGIDSKIPLPQLGCGEPKIIGFDYSWIATRAEMGDPQMRIELAKDKTLLIEAKLADCQSE